MIGFMYQESVENKVTASETFRTTLISVESGPFQTMGEDAIFPDVMPFLPFSPYTFPPQMQFGARTVPFICTQYNCAEM